MLKISFSVYFLEFTLYKPVPNITIKRLLKIIIRNEIDNKELDESKNANGK